MFYLGMIATIPVVVMPFFDGGKQMKEQIFSNTTGKQYCPSEVVRILNLRQATLYMANGAELLDIYPSIDFKTNEKVLVFIFDRTKTYPLYDAWCNHTLV